MGCRSEINYLTERVLEIKSEMEDLKSQPNYDLDTLTNLEMKLHACEESLNFAWQDDEAEYGW